MYRIISYLRYTPVWLLARGLLLIGLLVGLFGYMLDRSNHLHTGDIIYLSVCYILLSVLMCIVITNNNKRNQLDIDSEPVSEPSVAEMIYSKLITYAVYVHTDSNGLYSTVDIGYNMCIAQGEIPKHDNFTKEGLTIDQLIEHADYILQTLEGDTENEQPTI